MPARCRSLPFISVVAVFGLAAVPAGAAPLTPGNILIIQDTIREVTPSGMTVQTLTVPTPAPGPGASTIRDAAVTADGRLAVYHGTFAPFLNMFEPVTGTSQAFNFPGWSTTNTLLGGGVATRSNVAFATDMRTLGSPLEMLNGLIRFDTTTGSGQRFADGVDFIDVAVGFDGLLYGLPGGTFPAGPNVRVFDPDSLQPLHTVSLSGTGQAGVFAVAVNGSGEIFAGSGNIASTISVITRHSASGQLLGSLMLPGTGIFGLDLDGNGNLVGISGNGRVFLTTESLTSFTEVPNVRQGGDVNVAFVPQAAAVPEPGTLALLGLGALGLLGYRRRLGGTASTRC